MSRRLTRITYVVRDYDEAIDFWRSALGFVVLEDRPVPEQQKRWVVIAPSHDSAVGLVLGRASNEQQSERIGDQTGGRVSFFLETDDIQADLHSLTARGVRIVRPPTEADYGTVAVFEDLYGNYWDLIQPPH